MPKKRVNCPSCNASHVLDLDTDQQLRVPTCQECGAAGVMEMGLDFSLTQLPHPGVPRIDRWDVRMLERSLAGSTEYRKLITLSYTNKGYDFIGFHGCGANSARSMMIGGIDPGLNTVGARGRGFYVGSLYTGIPADWATKAERKGHGKATLLAVYVKNFGELTWGTDYDWGKMDGDDEIAETGLEIVFFGDACKRLRVVPALGVETTALWLGCPQDSLGFEERAKVRQAALHLRVREADLISWICDEKLAKHLDKDQLKLLESFF